MPVQLLTIKVSKGLYLRDPQESELGRRIIGEGVKLLDKLGFEGFTFKKLGTRIGSPEASIYRYFKNKRQFLQYITALYWGWIKFRIDMILRFHKGRKERIEALLSVLTEIGTDDPATPFVDEKLLCRVVMSQSKKVFPINKAEQEGGCTKEYRVLLRSIGDIILSINPKFKFPLALSSTLLSAAHEQIQYSTHFTSLTELKGRNSKKMLREFLKVLLAPALTQAKCHTK